jgi:hypothetical protein
MIGATLMWPAVAVLGFFVFTGVVVALGTSSTARYEFERNGAHVAQGTAAQSKDNHPAGRRAAGRPTGSGNTHARPEPGGVAVRLAPTTGDASAWWLVGESAEVVEGPFADRIDADWAALAGGLPAVAVFGARRADGTVAPKPSPEERAWLRELGDQLDRLPDEWDTLLSDTDPLTTLVVEIAAGLVEAGLPLHDPTAGDSAGGICLVPEPGLRGVLVSWRTHDRMSLHRRRCATADAAVQQLMNVTVADVLLELGFGVESYGATGCSLVTAFR